MAIALGLLSTFLLSHGLTAAADPQLSASQEQSLIAAAAGFAQGDDHPAQKAFPTLKNTYMGSWVGYWALQPQLGHMTQSEYRRYSLLYPTGAAHHLLRRQWLLQLGHREDWTDFTEVYQQGAKPTLLRLRCDALRDSLLASAQTTVSPFLLWTAAAPGNHPCNAMARDYLQRGEITQDELWQRLRQFYTATAFTAALKFARFLPPAQAGQLAQTVQDPAAWITGQMQQYGTTSWPDNERQLLVLALLRLAASHPAQAVQFSNRLNVLLASDKALILYIGAFNAALSFRAEARSWYAEAYASDPRFHPRPKVLAWMVRTALRSEDWGMVEEATQEMDPPQRQRREWQFWSAIALRQLGHPQAAAAMLTALATPWTYYGQLAMAALDKPLQLEDTDPPPSAQRVAALRGENGFRRALTLYRLGLYYDALDEWDDHLQAIHNPKSIRAAAQLAFDHQAWLLGIHTSSRIPHGADWRQGYVLPFAQDIASAAAQADLHDAFLAGLIRQESGFATGIQSSVGASGLMQVMPATAAWIQGHVPATAKANLRSISGNLLLGSSYLRLLLTQFSGSEILAAAAYNAGPSAPQRWLQRWAPPPGRWAGPIFAANIPYRQTRHYVQDVLTNTTIYAALLSQRAQPIWPELDLGNVETH
ncbi:MAG: lytic transglycosylase domain-containing protein [Acidithiobacillus sp.]